MRLYDGPVVDAHHHLWTYAPGRNPWLDTAENRPLARDVTPTDHRAAAGDLDIAGTVFIEALASDPHGEAVEAAALHRADPKSCNAVVAHVPLDAPDAAARLDALLRDVPAFRGVRDIVAVRPGFPSFARSRDLLGSPAFEAGLAALAERGLSFDLMLEPHQMADALRLVRRLPRLFFIVEHAGSPDFSSEAGSAEWRAAMRTASELPNVAVKLSALHCRMPGWTDSRLAGPIRELIGWFGADRVAFASDHPVHDLACPFRRGFETVALAVSGLSGAEQRAVFHDTARRLYRF